MKSLNDILNEGKSNYNLKDFDFYKSRNRYDEEIYSFYHGPSELEADIITAVRDSGRGKSQAISYVDYLEFVDEPDSNVVDELEDFIGQNLDYIFKNAEKI